MIISKEDLKQAHHQLALLALEETKYWEHLRGLGHDFDLEFKNGPNTQSIKPPQRETE